MSEIAWILEDALTSESEGATLQEQNQDEPVVPLEHKISQDHMLSFSGMVLHFPSIAATSRRAAINLHLVDKLTPRFILSRTYAAQNSGRVGMVWNGMGAGEAYECFMNQPAVSRVHTLIADV